MKKFGKGSLMVMAALFLSLGVAAYVGAQSMGGGMGKGPSGPGHMMMRHALMNLTPDQAGKLFDLKEKFRTDTASLRKDMMVKRLEMRDLWKAENPDEKAIQTKQKEINGLRDQMALKFVSFRLEAKKIAPNLGKGRMGMGPGCGMGRGTAEGPGMEHIMCMEMGPEGPGATPAAE